MSVLGLIAALMAIGFLDYLLAGACVVTGTARLPDLTLVKV